MGFKKWLEDYHGEHTAPNRESGSPLYDVTGVYPEDIYSHLGVRYYGEGSILDSYSINLIQAVRNKPNASVKVYRAVPRVITNQEKINDLEKRQAYILKYGKLPSDISGIKVYLYYEKLGEEINRLKSLPEIGEEKRVKINIGDWVTINRGYAVEHGKSNLRNVYRILSKTVRAKDLYTSGDSIHEWGYDPS